MQCTISHVTTQYATNHARDNAKYYASCHSAKHHASEGNIAYMTRQKELCTMNDMAILCKVAYTTRQCNINDKEVLHNLASTACQYWAVQAGLLAPLTFSRHRLSTLAAFTSGAYFLHNGRR